ncbi:unnamed protein product [Brassicogethes aeneus]|uniref:Uncharacterized protein n=1 Tax=Brassicogethes aeneus TaxID=1431903 RepID=A0A9P0AWR5_BRAAE|nr:unnamed protein product [Brassicogethes aeneus]
MLYSQYLTLLIISCLGFSSTATQRSLKAKGSIRIHGICPSNITAKISTSGYVTVTFFETHVGHEDDLRTKRLSKSEQNVLCGKIKCRCNKPKNNQKC